MNTRRDMAVGLCSLPFMAKALDPQQPTNALAELPVEQNTEMKPVPLPHSVAAANIISYTIYAEARGEPFAGKMAVASVIKTRSELSKKSLAEICLQDRQFSCWNGLKTVPDFFVSGEGIQSDDLQARSECYGIAWVLMVSKRKWDHLTHFYNPDKATPVWAYDLKGTRIIGKHLFGYIDQWAAPPLNDDV